MMTKSESRRCPEPPFSEYLKKFQRSEDGSILLLTIFFFLTMVMVAGLAVDLMRFENARVTNQATMDNAVLAATGLDQELDPVDVINDYYTKAGLTPPPAEFIKVTEDYLSGSNGQNGELAGRTVEVVSPVVSPNLFSNWVNVDRQFRHHYEELSDRKGREAKAPQYAAFGSGIRSVAEERIQNVEISLVVDISGSMGSNNRLVNLKKAAESFFEIVIDEDRTEGITSVSVVPYNAVVVTGDLLNYLNAKQPDEWGNNIPDTVVANPPNYPGALAKYNSDHIDSSCVRFRDDDFDDVVIQAPTRTEPGTPLQRVSHFKENGNSYKEPSMSQRWCNEGRASILVHETSIDTLNEHIRGLKSGGWTGVDNGVKWAVALLDPAIRPAVNDMIDDDLIPVKAEDRPNDYNPSETMKIIVVMTDGANTVQRDLKDKYKNGPAPIWHSHDRWSTDDDPSYDQKSPWDTTGRTARVERRNVRICNSYGCYWDWRNVELTPMDGFYTLNPDESYSRRWYEIGKAEYVAENNLPQDAKQLDYITLYERYAENDLAETFFPHDNSRRNAHRSAVTTHDQYGQVDDRLSDICQAARKSEIMIYALAFEAPTGGKNAMRDCATAQGTDETEGKYYEVSGGALGTTFKAIAGEITKLRLTQ